MNLDSISRLCRYNFGSTGWIAVDEDLSVWFYSNKPHKIEGYWVGLGTRVVCTKYTGDKDWKDSLTSLANIEPLCLSCENHHVTSIHEEIWYCSVELTNPNNMCIGYKMRGLDVNTR